MTFLDGMNRHVEENMAKSEQRFGAKALKKICSFYSIDCYESRHEADFGFGWFHTNYPDFPVFLEARHGQFSWDDILDRLTTTKPWKELLELIETSGRKRARHGLPYVGILMQAKKHGIWVFHTATFLEQQMGHSRVTHQARTRERQILVDPFEGFLESVKAHGWTANG